jgi:hypothetical protein
MIQGDLESETQTPSIQADHILIIAASPKGAPMNPTTSQLGVNPTLPITRRIYLTTSKESLHGRVDGLVSQSKKMKKIWHGNNQSHFIL